MMNMPGMPPGMPPPPPMPQIPFPPQPMGGPPMSGPQPVDSQGTNPRDMASALMNKPGGGSPFVTDDEGGVPAWLKGFLQSPFAKWKGESQQAMEPSGTSSAAFQPPSQMGQTHQAPSSQMQMAPAWAQSHNMPTQ